MKAPRHTGWRFLVLSRVFRQSGPAFSFLKHHSPSLPSHQQKADDSYHHKEQVAYCRNRLWIHWQLPLSDEPPGCDEAPPPILASGESASRYVSLTIEAAKLIPNGTKVLRAFLSHYSHELRPLRARCPMSVRFCLPSNWMRSQALYARSRASWKVAPMAVTLSTRPPAVTSWPSRMAVPA